MNFGLFETIHYYPEFENREFREVLKIHNKFGTVPQLPSHPMTSDILIYPYGRAAFHPHDNFDTLTRSMRELTRYADHIARALAEPGSHSSNKPSMIKSSDGNKQLRNTTTETRAASSTASSNRLEGDLRRLLANWCHPGSSQG